MTSRAAIDAFLAHPAIAIVGVSRSGKKFGNIARRTLRDKGYRVYPIHPSAPVIDGDRCYARFADLPERVAAALIVVPPDRARRVVEDAAAAGIRHVWLQQGAESVEAEIAGDKLGLNVICGECILMFADPKGIHKAHRWVRRVLRTLPAAGRP